MRFIYRDISNANITSMITSEGNFTLPTVILHEEIDIDARTTTQGEDQGDIFWIPCTCTSIRDLIGWLGNRKCRYLWCYVWGWREKSNIMTIIDFSRRININDLIINVIDVVITSLSSHHCKKFRHTKLFTVEDDSARRCLHT